MHRESPGKFDARTLSRKTLSRWTGRTVIIGPNIYIYIYTYIALYIYIYIYCEFICPMCPLLQNTELTCTHMFGSSTLDTLTVLTVSDEQRTNWKRARPASGFKLVPFRVSEGIRLKRTHI